MVTLSQFLGFPLEHPILKLRKTSPINCQVFKLSVRRATPLWWSAGTAGARACAIEGPRVKFLRVRRGLFVGTETETQRVYSTWGLCVECFRKHCGGYLVLNRMPNWGQSSARARHYLRRSTIKNHRRTHLLKTPLHPTIAALKNQWTSCFPQAWAFFALTSEHYVIRLA